MDLVIKVYYSGDHKINVIKIILKIRNEAALTCYSKATGCTCSLCPFHIIAPIYPIR